MERRLDQYQTFTFLKSKWINVWKQYRSSRRRVFCRKSVLRNFAKFTGKHLFQSLFFNKVAGLRPALWHRCFSMNFAKFLRTPFLTEHSCFWLNIYQMIKWFRGNSTRNYQRNDIPVFKIRHNFLKDFFFSAVITEWNNLNINIRNSSSVNLCKKYTSIVGDEI